MLCLLYIICTEYLYYDLIIYVSFAVQYGYLCLLVGSTMLLPYIVFGYESLKANFTSNSIRTVCQLNNIVVATLKSRYMRKICEIQFST